MWKTVNVGSRFHGNGTAKAGLPLPLHSLALLPAWRISQEKMNLMKSLSMNENPNSGRPPELTDKQIDELLQALTDGAPLSSIVEGDEWPSYRSIFRRLERDDEFRRRYDRARAIQAKDG